MQVSNSDSGGSNNRDAVPPAEEERAPGGQEKNKGEALSSAHLLLSGRSDRDGEAEAGPFFLPAHTVSK